MSTVGLIGWKVGMTRVFDEQGASTAVTVVSVPKNRVSQVKCGSSDGYDAIQVSAGEVKRQRISKPLQGHFDKSGLEAMQVSREFRVEDGNAYELGAELDLGGFEAGQWVDVQGTTKGRGFAGTMRRYGFGGGRASHGNSKAHRKPGSIGQCQDPGRIWPGKKMAGHLGAVKRTCQNLRLWQVDEEKRVLIIQGAVPGSVNSMVLVTQAKKRS